MNRKVLFLVSLLLAFYINCNAKELKGFGNPKIGKIIKIEQCTINSKEKDGKIYPEYEIELILIKKVYIEKIVIKSNYLFGQSLKIINTEMIELDASNDAISELNKIGKCKIRINLSAIEKEAFKEKNSYGQLNEERISNMFVYLKYK
ncbi:hypothetical protein H0R92_00715 [Treponema sp. OMZ 840]|uniref:hypothetical protein n=1 Tax=Treponema sp. OMZ 840 TaxID=244313 RepID=UPI003D8A0D10